MGRIVAALLTGLVVAAIVVFAVESLNLLVYPHPEGTDVTNQAAMRELWRDAPFGARLVVLIAWLLGPLVGAWVCFRGGGQDQAAA